jgi:hypothetical protein
MVGHGLSLSSPSSAALENIFEEVDSPDSGGRSDGGEAEATVTPPEKAVRPS